MKMISLVVPLLSMTLVGCPASDDGTSDDTGGFDAKQITIYDAGPDVEEADAAPVVHECLVEDDYGDLGAISGDATLFPETGALDFNASMDRGDGTYDVVEVVLYPGFGVFLDGIVEGEFTLDATESDATTCGLCVFFWGGIDPDSGENLQEFMGDGGTFTLTSVEGNLTGSLANLTFYEADIDISSSNWSSIAVEDGCTTSVTAGTFDLTFVEYAGV